MKILIVTKNWIGDVLFQLPAIQALREHYPQAEITCLAPERCLDVLRSHPAVDRLIPFDERSTQRSLLNKLNFIFSLRREKWDKAYLFHRSKTRALLLALGGVRERVGFGEKRRFLLTRAYREPHRPGHHADTMLELLRQDGVSVPAQGSYRFYYSQAARERVQRLLKSRDLEEHRFAVFHLGANWEPKRWPPEHFAELADRLNDAFGLPVAVTGHAGDRALWESFCTRVRRARVVSFIGETTLEETGALFRRAAFLVTGDSGPMHIASGVGTPVLALFGPTHPDISGPRGCGPVEVLSYVPQGYKAPWYGNDMPHEGWLSRLLPEQAFEVLKKSEWAVRAQTGGGEPVSERTLLTDEENSVRRILWVTLSNIGDVLLTTPVLRMLAGRFPRAEITAVVGPRAERVLEKSRLIKRLVVYDKHAGFAQQLSFLRKLRQENYDLTVDLRRTAIPWLVRTRRRSPLYRRHQSVSMRDRHLEVLSFMGIRAGISVPAFDFYRPEEELSALRKLDEKKVPLQEGWILLAPVAASGLKTWAIEKFQKVLERLLESTLSAVLIVGDHRERDRAGVLTRVNPARVFNLAGETSFAETAALTARARLVIANDSALMHLAYEMGTPAAAVFGPTHQGKYGHSGRNFRIVRAGSACSPCEEPRCRFERQHCFEDLTPEALMAACEELLNEHSAASR